MQVLELWSRTKVPVSILTVLYKRPMNETLTQEEVNFVTRRAFKAHLTNIHRYHKKKRITVKLKLLISRKEADERCTFEKNTEMFLIHSNSSMTEYMR